MKIYKVGGCVRDKLIGKIPHDNDYLVIGATPKQMLDLGYKQVGKTFPVFLHPETKEEYALARKEIKIGTKHSDFLFIFSPDITLSEDLVRRDFTCNALAEDTQTGEIIDCVGGRKDIEKKVLHHINDVHFQEDPLRVLRMCRFAAQLRFDIAADTMNLAIKMVQNNMLAHLSKERVWEEFYKALLCPDFYRFISTGIQCGALQKLLPEISEFYKNKANIELLKQKTLHSTPKIRFAVFWLLSRNNIESAVTKKIHTPNDYAVLIKNYRLYTDTLLNSKTTTEELYDTTVAITGLINTSRLNELAELINIMLEPQSTLEKNLARCNRIFTICKPIRATDMPDFSQLPKDKNFGIAYRRYILQKISGL